MTLSSIKRSFVTDSGMLRIRWWPLAGFGLYLGYNAVVLAMVMAGAKGHADPFLHAPIYWLANM